MGFAPRRLWRNLWPLHALLSATLAILMASLLHLLGAGLGIVMLVVAALMLGGLTLVGLGIGTTRRARGRPSVTSGDHGAPHRTDRWRQPIRR